MGPNGKGHRGKRHQKKALNHIRVGVGGFLFSEGGSAHNEIQLQGLFLFQDSIGRFAHPHRAGALAILPVWSKNSSSLAVS